jgi:hypothetical protein
MHFPGPRKILDIEHRPFKMNDSGDYIIDLFYTRCCVSDDQFVTNLKRRSGVQLYPNIAEIIEKERMPALFPSWGNSPIETWADEANKRYRVDVSFFYNHATLERWASINIFGIHNTPRELYVAEFLQHLTLNKLWRNT